MKDFCLELASKQEGFNSKLNIMREYLQAYILRIMHDNGVFHEYAFLGGTALRFLYGLPRFSEDLDFSLVRQEKLLFLNLLKKIKEELSLAGYDVSLTYNDKKNVQHSFIKFGSLMFESGISPLKTQKFSIKIEFDVNPPDGAELNTVVVNKYFPISFMSYDVPSLFAGKIHALFSRKYTKGRDFFDLGWYLSKWKDLSPNLTLLRNALVQTGWEKDFPTSGNWVSLLQKTVADADWNKVKQDVQSFLENPSDLNILTKENVLNLIKQRKAK